MIMGEISYDEDAEEGSTATETTTTTNKPIAGERPFRIHICV